MEHIFFIDPCNENRSSSHALDLHSVGILFIITIIKRK